MASGPLTDTPLLRPRSRIHIRRQAIQTDSLVFLSGCIPLVPETMKVIEGGIEEQTVSPTERNSTFSSPSRLRYPRSLRGSPARRQRQAFRNFKAVLEASGCKITDVVKTTVFLQSLGDFGKVCHPYALSASSRDGRSHGGARRFPHTVGES